MFRVFFCKEWPDFIGGRKLGDGKGLRISCGLGGVFRCDIVGIVTTSYPFGLLGVDGAWRTCLFFLNRECRLPVTFKNP